MFCFIYFGNSSQISQWETCLVISFKLVIIILLYTVFMFSFISENTPHNTHSSTHSTKVNRLVPFLFSVPFLLSIHQSFLVCSLLFNPLPLPVLTGIDSFFCKKWVKVQYHSFYIPFFLYRLSWHRRPNKLLGQQPFFRSAHSTLFYITYSVFHIVLPCSTNQPIEIWVILLLITFCKLTSENSCSH